MGLLLESRLLPAFEGVETGMGERTRPLGDHRLYTRVATPAVFRVRIGGQPLRRPTAMKAELIH